MKKGYSFSELMIALTIIGVLSALTITVLRNTQNNYGILYRSAFKTSESVVSEIAANITLFPTGFLDSTTPASQFCNNFKNVMNTVGTTDCTASTVATTPNFTTTNGMRWFGFNNAFASATCVNITGNCMQIEVDVNGNNTPNLRGTDILKLIISNEGKLTPIGATETGYLTD